MTEAPLTIGWKEYLDFVDWGIRRVKTKIDTGARTSALGVVSYELWERPDHQLMARLQLALKRRHPEEVQEVVTPVLGMLVVANSNGMKEQRPVVETSIQLGPVVKRVRLTVTNRAGMLFRVILGRKALESDFLVDVKQKYLLKNRT